MKNRNISLADKSRYSDEEAEAQRKAKVYPSLSREYAESIIDAIHYDILSDGKTTACTLEIFNNSFSVQGHSSCLDARNFDAKLGRTYSYKRAFDRLMLIVAATVAAFDKDWKENRRLENLAQELESDIQHYTDNYLTDADGEMLNLLVKYKKMLEV